MSRGAPLLRPGRWPLALRVPVLVALLMIAAAAVLSQGVLQRLSRDQERHLAELSAAYLDGLATALQPAAIRRDVWETFDALDRARGRYTALHPGVATLVLPDGSILASSEPRRFAVGGMLPEGLDARSAEAAARGAPVMDEATARATLGRELVEGGIALGRIVAEVDIAPLLAERATVRRTLLLANGALTLLFAVLGFVLVRRLLRPLEMLRAQVAAGGETGRVQPLPAAAIARAGPEFAGLFDAWNRTAVAIGEREAMAARLAEEESYAQLGKLASGMAHEVNNPLGGLLTAVDTLATHGDDQDVREASVAFLRRGLDDIRNVVRASLVTYKGRPGDGPLHHEDLDDLRFLVRHEVERRGLRLQWENTLPAESSADRTLTRQIVLNLLLNACAASPRGATVRVAAAAGPDDGVVIDVSDEGPGLPAAAIALLADPEASPPGGGGLGLWIAVRLAQRLGGGIRLVTAAKGSRIRLEVPGVGRVAGPGEALADVA